MHFISTSCCLHFHGYKSCVPFPPWMATASTPFSNRYSWMASTSAFFSANINTCQHKHNMSIHMSCLSLSALCQCENRRKYWQEVVFSEDTPAGTPSWLPLWRIPLPANKHKVVLKCSIWIKFDWTRPFSLCIFHNSSCMDWVQHLKRKPLFFN